MKELKPASKGTSEAYTPTAMEMKHDPVFASLAPGVVNSGNLAHKYGAEGDHSIEEVPPTGLKGD